MCDDGIDYFAYAECLNDLVRTEHLRLTEDGCYAITPKGLKNSEIDRGVPGGGGVSGGAASAAGDAGGGRAVGAPAGGGPHRSQLAGRQGLILRNETIKEQIP